MKKYFICIMIIWWYYTSFAQNVGIGTNTPGFPLNFANTLGNKIALWGNTGNHYGFGVQSGLLQLYTDLPASYIVFGHGSSTSFTERMRIINSGENALTLNGRIMLRNGTFPLDLNYGGGVWLYKADNSATLGFMGVQNNQNMGFYGGPAGWGFTYDAINSRVGIGNNNPNAPLAFPPSLGKKITLYPGATGDVGFAVAGNRLQIYSDNPNADVAIGYDAAGTFNERFAVKPTGAIAVNGNPGLPGQLLSSNGVNSAAAWVPNPSQELYNNTEEIIATSGITVPTGQFNDIPGLTKTITLTKTSKIIVEFLVQTSGIYCAFCGQSTFDVIIMINGNNSGKVGNIVQNSTITSTSGKRIFTLNAGTYTFDIRGVSIDGPNIQFIGAGPHVSLMFVQVLPQY